MSDQDIRFNYGPIEVLKADLERVTKERDEQAHFAAAFKNSMESYGEQIERLQAVIEEAESWVEKIGYNATTLHGLKAILDKAKEQ